MMCADGTKKWEEEITEPLMPFSLSKNFSTDKLIAAFPEIQIIVKFPLCKMC